MSAYRLQPYQERFILALAGRGRLSPLFRTNRTASDLAYTRLAGPDPRTATPTGPSVGLKRPLMAPKGATRCGFQGIVWIDSPALTPEMWAAVCPNPQSAIRYPQSVGGTR